MKNFSAKIFPRSRIATLDVSAMGLKKHHVVVMIEMDVTDSRIKLREHRKRRERISFFGWLTKAISVSIKDHRPVAAYLKGKRRLIVFNDINVSVAVEKEIAGNRVPIPLVIEKASEKTIEAITAEISQAKEQVLTDQDIVLQNKSNKWEQVYYVLPGFIRRWFWHYLTSHPQFAFNKMGNVAITSVGGLGGANAWFKPISVHPVCFGIGDVVKKAVVIDDGIEIREMLNMTVLLDHDVVDGMEMAKFIKRLKNNIEQGVEL
ncbi:MAG: 2-oxo acid dehydrogenase subunit E2 [Bacteroides sp.]|jgi:pyruvate/2-oxoglutarate dehydrogenase complex dihydrolipoamide acyltransferase (E2) component|nr:2-oxo acid dehydrogenase subunit E2 [Bacteroides sp.]